MSSMRTTAAARKQSAAVTAVSTLLAILCDFMPLVFTMHAVICVSACSVARSCLTLCNPMDCNSPAPLSRNFQGKNTGVGGHFLLWGCSRLWEQICISCLGRQVLYHCTTWEACIAVHNFINKKEKHLSKCCLKVAPPASHPNFAPP